MFHSLRSFVLVLLLAGCSTPATAPSSKPAPVAVSPDARIVLDQSQCFFHCASFVIEVRPDGHYKLDNRRDTRKDGVSEGEFGPDVWARAQAAFETAHFATMPENLTSSDLSKPGSIPCINDLPFATFTRRASAGVEKTVVLNLGCKAPEAAQLLSTLRGLFQINALVEPDRH
jgi:hypothetical protein